jgi:hypothetical protein
MRTAKRVLACTALLLAACATAQAQSVVVPQPVPDGFGFPTDAATINGWVNNGNTASIRGHAWNLWAGITSAATQSGVNLPVWETWYGTNDVFPQNQGLLAASPQALLAPHPRALRSFVSPAQFRHIRTLAAVPTPSNIVSFNKFDPEAATFIVTPQPGPGSGTFNYNSGAGLASLNQAWPSGTSGQNRAINEFPVRGIETKPVFSLVKATGLTPQPLWQGPAGSTNAQNPTPNTWTTCVLIDPNGSGPVRPATAAEIDIRVDVGPSACTTFLYGPLSLLYSFKMDAAEAAAFTQAQGIQARAGDYAVLVAMHVNTKEIPFWTWQTFYWQPGADTPNGFPGSKGDQSSNVAAPWNNYAMCANYNQTVKPGSSQMDVCFNPYLETSGGIPAGITSNCMSCHGTALVGPNPTYPLAYTAPIDFFGDPNYFNTQSTHTDFSWAVADAP